MPYFSTSLLHLPLLFPNSWVYFNHFNNLKFWLYVKFLHSVYLFVSRLLLGKELLWQLAACERPRPAWRCWGSRSREKQAALKLPPPNSAQTCILLNITEEGAKEELNSKQMFLYHMPLFPFPKILPKLRNSL